VYVLREAWEARQREVSHAGEAPGELAAAARGPHPAAAGDEFISRFVQRDGIAYALLFAAAAGRLDLFLWAAAVASHLFYVLWLIARPRSAGGTMAFGRPA
jgi:hypothetical protein